MTVDATPVPDPDVSPARQLRASHVDRDAVVEVLRIAAGDGRLTPAELDERLEAALTAKTYAELAVLTADLPAAGQPPVAATVPAKDLVQIDCRSGSITIVTRPGIEVDADDVAVRSGSVGIRHHRGPAVPVTLRVRVSGHVGSGSFKARPPRRSFLAWLLRRPPVYA